MYLQKLLLDVCKITRLDRIPKLAVCTGFAAEARLGKIRIGQRLYSLLSEKEMKGVIAHEVHHIMKLRKYIVLSITVGILLIVIAGFAELTAYLSLVLRYPALVFYFTPDLFRLILVASLTLLSLESLRYESRVRELNADTIATFIVGSRTFVNVLKKVHSIKTKPRLGSRLWDGFSPHSSLDRRISAVQDLERAPLSKSAR